MSIVLRDGQIILHGPCSTDDPPDACNAYCHGNIHAVLTYWAPSNELDTDDLLRRTCEVAGLKLIDMRPAPEAPPVAGVFSVAFSDGMQRPSGTQITLTAEHEPLLLIVEVLP